MATKPPTSSCVEVSFHILNCLWYGHLLTWLFLSTREGVSNWPAKLIKRKQRSPGQAHWALNTDRGLTKIDWDGTSIQIIQQNGWFTWREQKFSHQNWRFHQAKLGWDASTRAKHWCASHLVPTIRLLWSLRLRGWVGAGQQRVPSQTRPPKAACLVMCRWRLQGITISNDTTRGLMEGTHETHGCWNQIARMWCCRTLPWTDPMILYPRGIWVGFWMSQELRHFWFANPQKLLDLEFKLWTKRISSSHGGTSARQVGASQKSLKITTL